MLEESLGIVESPVMLVLNDLSAFVLDTVLKVTSSFDCYFMHIKRFFEIRRKSTTTTIVDGAFGRTSFDDIIAGFGQGATNLDIDMDFVTCKVFMEIFNKIC